MLRVDVQCFPIIVLSLLCGVSQSSKIVHGASMARVQPESGGKRKDSKGRREKQRKNYYQYSLLMVD